MGVVRHPRPAQILFIFLVAFLWIFLEEFVTLQN
jgi:hypothetical protein